MNKITLLNLNSFSSCWFILYSVLRKLEKTLIDLNENFIKNVYSQTKTSKNRNTKTRIWNLRAWCGSFILIKELVSCPFCQARRYTSPCKHYTLNSCCRLLLWSCHFCARHNTWPDTNSSLKLNDSTQGVLWSHC